MPDLARSTRLKESLCDGLGAAGRTSNPWRTNRPGDNFSPFKLRPLIASFSIYFRAKIITGFEPSIGLIVRFGLNHDTQHDATRFSFIFYALWLLEGVTNTQWPSSCISPKCSLLTTTGSNQTLGEVKTYRKQTICPLISVGRYVLTVVLSQPIITT